MSSIVNDIKTVPQTFSSWDSCMSKAYCKWPVIAGIIVASLILISVLWCVASCLCCGASLCASCVQCLTCFGCCGACKSGRRGGSRNKDDYSQMPPTPYNGYQPQPAPMMQYQQPQFASFDGPTKAVKIHEDSLPAMPSWDTASTQRVEDHSEPAQGHGHDVEMGRMGPPRTMRGGYSQLPPNGPISPISASANHGYFQGQQQAQPYSSDLGAQRMPMNNRAYDDFSAVPLSPAPTYATNPPQNQHMLGAAGARTDRFASGAVSPTPYQYNQQQNQPQAQYQQSQPYQSTRPQPLVSPPESTIYEASDYNSYRPQSISPPILNHPAHQYSGYEAPQQNSGIRPPSLLQIGRKPVNGSRREI